MSMVLLSTEIWSLSPKSEDLGCGASSADDDDATNCDVDCVDATYWLAARAPSRTSSGCDAIDDADLSC